MLNLKSLAAAAVDIVAGVANLVLEAGGRLLDAAQDVFGEDD